MKNKKTAVVTGATSGLGLATVKTLLEKGYDVLGTSRSAEKEKKAMDAIGQTIPFIQVDLTSIKQQQAFSEHVETWLAGRGLSVLVNNAGTFYSHHSLSPEGLEKQFAVNTIAPLHLSMLLYEKLKKGHGRIVNVNSNSHYGTHVHWDDMQLSRHYGQLKAYKQTKLFSVMVSRQFNKHSDTVKTYMADPGLVNTDMGFKNTTGLATLVWKMRKKKGQPTQQGAATQIYLATQPELNGFYYRDCKEKAPDRQTKDDKNCQRIWDYCINVLGLDPDAIFRKA